MKPMTLVLRFAALVCALCLGENAMADGRTLQNLALVDASGRSIQSIFATQPERWAIIFVDADRTHAQKTILRLYRQSGDWNERLIVVATGKAAAFQGLVGTNRGVKGVVWLRYVGTNLPSEAGFSGYPTLMGMTRESGISWQVAGLPGRPDKAQSLIASWLWPPFAASTKGER